MLSITTFSSNSSSELTSALSICQKANYSFSKIKSKLPIRADELSIIVSADFEYYRGKCFFKRKYVVDSERFISLVSNSLSDDLNKDDVINIINNGEITQYIKESMMEQNNSIYQKSGINEKLVVDSYIYTFDNTLLNDISLTISRD